MQNLPNHLTPDDLAVPEFNYKKTIILTNSTPSHVHLPDNVKSFVLVASGPIHYRADLCESVQETPGDLSNTAKDNILPQDEGQGIFAQGRYINTISAVRQSEENGTDTLVIIPGRGVASNLSGVEWDILPYEAEV